MQTISAIMKFLWLVYKNYRVGVSQAMLQKSAPVTIRTRGDDHKKQKESNAKTSIYIRTSTAAAAKVIYKGVLAFGWVQQTIK